MIKHVSFDVWNTIIKNNPQFGKIRNANFEKILSKFGVEINEIKTAQKKVKSYCDNLGETCHIGLERSQLLYLFLIELFSVYEVKNILKSYPFLINALSDAYDGGFNKNMPQLISNDFLTLLDYLKANNISTNIMSNTGFANKENIKQCLKHYNILNRFDFCLFSDESKKFKPNPDFFDEIFVEYYNLFYQKIEPHEILHVGDNENADVFGAKNVGMQAFLFSPSNPNYNEIIALIENSR